MQQPNAALVLLSGGLDSTVLLHEVFKTYRCPKVYALAFDYGQRHVRELECARAQASLLRVDHLEVVSMQFIGELVAGGSSLVTGGAEVPDLSELQAGELDQPPTYVPNRNMMLLSIAAAYAEANGIRDIYYGAQAQDEYGYWDCTQPFLDRVNAVLSLNRRETVTIHAPFIQSKKAELVMRGQALDVDFAQTWSCYRGGSHPCNTCPTCVERANAFAEAGLHDPLIATA